MCTIVTSERDANLEGVNLKYPLLGDANLSGADLSDGSIALYVGPHQVMQAIPGEGVTDRYTDQQTYGGVSRDTASAYTASFRG